MTELVTEAGRRLLARQERHREHGTRGLFFVDLGDVRAIEREAVLAYQEELRAKIEGLPDQGTQTGNDPIRWSGGISRAAVLAALKEAAK